MLKLYETPKRSVIIEGFPGIGLVGSIATEYLIDHLKARLIGKIIIEKAPSLIAIHKKELVQPLGIFYSESKNIVIVHALTSFPGIEWDLSYHIMELAEKIKARQIFCIEGVPSESEEPKTYFFSTDRKTSKKLEKQGLTMLENGIIMGVTSSMLVVNDDIPLCCLFAEAHAKLPDSRSAASVLKQINDILELKIDIKPLMQRAEDFEEKIKSIVTKAKGASELQKQKSFNYVG
ncbi:MAG TPA: PAC2 family protein [Candidatus Woesearchaeota archaeon]|nr:PAC2 family protein [Candidatus Woesearchaeota archaeon]